jgi:hypothetical protein
MGPLEMRLAMVIEYIWSNENIVFQFFLCLPYTLKTRVPQGYTVALQSTPRRYTGTLRVSKKSKPESP